LGESNSYAKILSAPAAVDRSGDPVSVILGGMPAASLLHQLLQSPETKQACLAILLGKHARRTVRLHHADVSLPQYFRLLAKLCRDVAEQTEAEAASHSRGSAAPAPPPGVLSEAQGELPDFTREVVDAAAPPKEIADALNAKDFPKALRLAIGLGERDENVLTNLVFFAKHKELSGQKLDAKTPNYAQLSAEWLSLLNKDVWRAIQAASDDASLVVSGSEVADHDRFFWGATGKRLKRLVENAAKEADLDPGLLGTVMMAETRRPQSYLSNEKVSSYHIGTDDFFEAQAAIAARVPAFSKVKFDKTQKPIAHLNDAITPREVKTILFDSGRDAVLATAVYLKFREVRLREIAKDLKGDFDTLPRETRFALTRMAMAAGTAGATPFLRDALAGQDIMVRKAVPVKIFQTQRNATVRAAQALHLSEWIFGPNSAPAMQNEVERENFEAADREHGTPAAELEEHEAALEAEAETGQFGVGTRKKATNTRAIPFRWICSISASLRVTSPTHQERRGLAPAGTGILISPCHVLTAAHVLKSIDEQSSSRPLLEAETLTVTPGRDESQSPFGTFAAKSWKLHPHWDPNAGSSGTDLAVITLDKCVSKELGFWNLENIATSVKSTLPGGAILTAGYPESKKTQMWCFSGRVSIGSPQADAAVVQNGQAVRWFDTNPVLRLNADVEKGQSGSPVWTSDHDGLHLVGMLVDAGTDWNIAVTLNDRALELIRQWIGTSSASAHEFEAESGGDHAELEGLVEEYPTIEVPYAGQAKLLESIQEFDFKPPAGLVILDHQHIPKTPDAASPGHFKLGTVGIMTPETMNPGFIDAHDELATDTGETGLQTCLEKAITDQFGRLLRSKTSKKPAAGDRVHIAIVDLSGTKLSRPDFSGWGSTVAVYGASSAKIIAVYAAFQLRNDLRMMAQDQAIPTGKELEAFAKEAWKAKKFSKNLPNLKWLFDLEHWSAQPNDINFTADAKRAFGKISHNAEASKIIRAVGFPYIASVAWQSGLRHPVRGGLWLSAAYDGGDHWEDSPSMKAPAFGHNITALSVATYFTLLAQGRLVDDASSAEIRTVLRAGCRTCLFPTEIPLAATKCGIFKPYMHDCFLVDRTAARYGAGILTELDAVWPGWPEHPLCPTGPETAVYTDLCRAMDQLVVNNNAAPKVKCT